MTEGDDRAAPSILHRLAKGEVLISDGATGTYLQAHGLEPGGCPEEFNFSNPEVVQGMARDYFEAGSNLVLTNSFGGNRFMLAKYRASIRYCIQPAPCCLRRL
jgi:5-methyltetrahydrofolate--homocysteine methyltransferase